MALTVTALLTGGGNVDGSGGSLTITPTVAVNAGDVILVAIYAGGSATTFTGCNDGDTVNTAQYAQAATFRDSTNSKQLTYFWKVAGQANSPATPITLTWTPTGNFMNTFTYKVSGFTGTPTLGTINGTTFSQTTASTSVVWSPLVTDHANEAVMTLMNITTGSPSSGFTGWSNPVDQVFEQVVATSGTNIAVTAGVWSVAAVWDALVFAVYDAPIVTTPGFLTSPSVITTSGFTLAAWNTVSLSGIVPSGSKGAILSLSTTASGTVSTLGLRQTGSTDTWQQTSNTGIGASSQQYRHVGLNGSLQFDCYPAAGTNFAGTTFEVVGYYGTEVVFETTAIQLSALSAGSYNTINAVTAGVPSGAVGVIVSFGNHVSQTFGVRQNGSSDDYSIYGTGINTNAEVICGLDGAGNFQVKTNAASLVPYIVGYFPSGSSFQWNPTAISVTPNTAGSAQSLSPEVGAVAYIYQVANGVVYTIEGSAASGLPAEKCPAGSMGQALCGASPTANLPTLTSANIWELGFFGPPANRVNTTVYYRPALQFVDESVIQN